MSALIWLSKSIIFSGYCVYQWWKSRNSLNIRLHYARFHILAEVCILCHSSSWHDAGRLVIFNFSIISFFNDSIQGWPAFVVSLIFIGFLAAVISDFAKIFGCLVGLRDEVTAITIVTFGTSMIDVFATRKAVKMDSTADNSLGNVIAANSISVFLGKS